MIAQKEKNVINKLFEAVDILRKHIDNSEAVKRVFVLYIILNGLFKFKRTRTPKRLSHKGKRDRIKFESTPIPQFLASIDDVLRKASPPIAGALKIRKYASGIPLESFWEMLGIILLAPKYSANERRGVIRTFCLSSNIRELVVGRKPKATPDSLGKLIIKIFGLDYYGVEDVFHSIDESIFPFFDYDYAVNDLLNALHCDEKEKGTIFNLAMAVAGVKNNWETFSHENFEEPPEDYIPEIVFCNPIDSEDFDADKSDSFYQDFFSKVINDHLDSFTWKMGIIVPLSNLSDYGKMSNLLRTLLDKDQIETIIQLPEKLFLPRTPIATGLIILNKQKDESRRNRVAFVRSGYRQKGNDVEISNREIARLCALFKRFKPNWNNIAVVQYDQITCSDNNLLPSFYIDSLRRDLEGLNTNNLGIPLESLGKIVQGGSNTMGLEQLLRFKPYVTAKDLHPEKANMFLDNVMKKTKLDTKQTKISEKGILISLRHESLKPTIPNPLELSTIYKTLIGSSEVLINKGVIAIIPNENVIDIEYLYFQIYSDLVTRQILSKMYESYKKKTYLKLEDLKSLIIRVPSSIEEQKEIVGQEKKILIEEEFMKHQREIIALRKRLNVTEIKEEAEFKIVGHLTHEINPILAMLEGPITRVYQLLESKNLLDEALCKNMGGTEEKARDALDQALRKRDLIRDLLDGTRNLVEMKIDRREFSRVNICDVFRHDIEPLGSGEQYVIRVACDVQSEVFMHRSFFVVAMQNIIKNAKMHAFQENQPDGEIKFQITERGENIVIDYTNNGRNFPNNMTTEDFLTLGKKAVTSPGRGYGGAWIGKVINAHNGIFEIIRDDNPVHLRITLPKEG